VILWDDTFVRYHEPGIGQAAVRVLEAAGFEVILPTGRRCCGRPAFSQGDLATAGRLGRHNLALLEGSDTPILFLEPSCHGMFAEDYRELNLPGAEKVARRCFLFEQFIEQLLQREPDALPLAPVNQDVAIHAHCQAKARLNPGFMANLAQRGTRGRATIMDTGCCGMAGAFGAMASKYDLSVAVGRELVDKIAALPSGTALIASGTSCRQQITHLTSARPQHLAEWLSDRLKTP
jgi:Fe-S oxidoreductase